MVLDVLWPPSPTASAELELTVSGQLGPVLRSALLPCVAARTQNCTVVRLVTSADVDVPALVKMLESLGVNFASVRRFAR